MICCSHRRLSIVFLNVQHSFLCLYFSISCFLPNQIWFSHSYESCCSFSVQTNFKELSFKSKVWFRPMVSLTSACKNETTHSTTYNFLFPIIYWSKSQVQFDDIFSVQPPHHRPKPLSTPSSNYSGPSHIPTTAPSLSYHLIIIFIVRQFVLFTSSL